MEEKIKEIMADILDIDEDEISADFGPEDTSLWDSMNNLRLITSFEENFKIKFSMEEIEKMTTYSNIKATIESKC